MSQKIIIYGGAFNPPTMAHLAILNRLIEEADRLGGEVWLLPSGSRNDKTIQVPARRRLQYVDALIESSDRVRCPVRIETHELTQSGMTNTFDTVQHLTMKYPDNEFRWVFGTDSVRTMKDWHNGNALFEELHVIVVARSGYELLELPPHAHFLSVDTPIISSTTVRERLASGMSVEGLVPKAVNVLLV